MSDSHLEGAAGLVAPDPVCTPPNLAGGGNFLIRQSAWFSERVVRKSRLEHRGLLYVNLSGCF